MTDNAQPSNSSVSPFYRYITFCYKPQRLGFSKATKAILFSFLWHRMRPLNLSRILKVFYIFAFYRSSYFLFGQIRIQSFFSNYLQKKIGDYNLYTVNTVMLPFQNKSVHRISNYSAFYFLTHSI